MGNPMAKANKEDNMAIVKELPEAGKAVPGID